MTPYPRIRRQRKRPTKLSRKRKSKTSNERMHPESAVAHQLPKAKPIKRIHSMILSVKVLTPTKSGNAYKILRSRERLPAVTTTTYGRTCTHHRHEGYADYRTVTAYSRCRRQNLPA